VIVALKDQQRVRPFETDTKRRGATHDGFAVDISRIRGTDIASDRPDGHAMSALLVDDQPVPQRDDFQVEHRA